VLIREEPATELTVATRILAHGGALAADGHVALVTGEVVYVAGDGISNHTMTPYDVTIVRLRDGLDLFGTPPSDIGRYLDALRARPEARAAVLAEDGTLVTGDGLSSVVAMLVHRPWDEAEAHAKAAGALIGAYPPGG
jgi:ribulose-5-phosphate 4-epimerase/fuculose-1-phosphate aldolase